MLNFIHDLIFDTIIYIDKPHDLSSLLNTLKDNIYVMLAERALMHARAYYIYEIEEERERERRREREGEKKREDAVLRPWSRYIRIAACQVNYNNRRIFRPEIHIFPPEIATR